VSLNIVYFVVSRSNNTVLNRISNIPITKVFEEIFFMTFIKKVKWNLSAFVMSVFVGFERKERDRLLKERFLRSQ
jgi:hypothetical protein